MMYNYHLSFLNYHFTIIDYHFLMLPRSFTTLRSVQDDIGGFALSDNI